MKKKLSLEALSVKSFVTKTGEKAETVKGGNSRNAPCIAPGFPSDFCPSAGCPSLAKTNCNACPGISTGAAACLCA